MSDSSKSNFINLAREGKPPIIVDARDVAYIANGNPTGEPYFKKTAIRFSSDNKPLACEHAAIKSVSECAELFKAAGIPLLSVPESFAGSSDLRDTFLNPAHIKAICGIDAGMTQVFLDWYNYPLRFDQDWGDKRHAALLQTIVAAAPQLEKFPGAMGMSLVDKNAVDRVAFFERKRPNVPWVKFLDSSQVVYYQVSLHLRGVGGNPISVAPCFEFRDDARRAYEVLLKAGAQAYTQKDLVDVGREPPAAAPSTLAPG